MQTASRFPRPLGEEIAQIVANDPAVHAGYYLKRQFFFLGRWLKHGGLYPTLALCDYSGAVTPGLRIAPE